MAASAWTTSLKGIYDGAVAKYRAGERGADSFFSPEETAFLSSIGLRPINVYDHAEDLVKYGEPSWETFLLVAAARRDYFLYKQGGQWSFERVAESDLPAKAAEIEGVAWLPRIARKAVAFLEGTLCEEIMYGCGGDRNFLDSSNIHAADFVRIAWAEHGDPARILAFLRKRK